MEKAGGRALALPVDVRDDAGLRDAMAAAAEAFGGIDILVNNASALSLTDTPATPMRRYDLIMGINTRGTFAATQAALPFLREAANPHILTLSPPLDLNPKWFRDTTAYTMSKFGMSMCVIGHAAEFAKYGDRRERPVAENLHLDRRAQAGAGHGLGKPHARRKFWPIAPTSS